MASPMTAPFVIKLSGLKILLISTNTHIIINETLEVQGPRTLFISIFSGTRIYYKIIHQDSIVDTEESIKLIVFYFNE